jgi:hypothetical protein
LPTSVLLAVLVAAGLLALAPALVRRYDATERLEAERETSQARVLSRARRRRSVPGRRPVNPPQALPPTLRRAAPPAGGVPAGGVPVDRAASGARDGGPEPAGSAVSSPRRAVPPPAEALSRRSVPSPRREVPSSRREASSSRREASSSRREASSSRREASSSRREVAAARVAPPRRPATSSRGGAPPPRRPARAGGSPVVHRRRWVLAALVLLNLVEVVGLAAVGPGYWVGFAVTATLLVSYLVHLRASVVADQRRRQAAARRARWLAARQAEVRLEQERRARARRESARRMAGQRESLRRTSAGWSAPPTVSYRRAGGPDG